MLSANRYPARRERHVQTRIASTRPLLVGAGVEYMARKSVKNTPRHRPQGEQNLQNRTTRMALDDVSMLLGELREGIKSIREDIAHSKMQASESRSKIFERLDQQDNKIEKLDETLRIEGQVTAQVRESVSNLEAVVDTNHASIAPALEDYRRVRLIATLVGGAVGLFGATFVGLAIWSGETIILAVRHWLKLP